MGFLDRIREGYRKVDDRLGGRLPGGVPRDSKKDDSSSERVDRVIRDTSPSFSPSVDKSMKESVDRDVKFERVIRDTSPSFSPSVDKSMKKSSSSGSGRKSSSSSGSDLPQSKVDLSKVDSPSGKVSDSVRDKFDPGSKLKEEAQNLPDKKENDFIEKPKNVVRASTKKEKFWMTPTGEFVSGLKSGFTQKDKDATEVVMTGTGSQAVGYTFGTVGGIGLLSGIPQKFVGSQAGLLIGKSAKATNIAGKIGSFGKSKVGKVVISGLGVSYGAGEVKQAVSSYEKAGSVGLGKSLVGTTQEVASFVNVGKGIGEGISKAQSKFTYVVSGEQAGLTTLKDGSFSRSGLGKGSIVEYTKYGGRVRRSFVFRQADVTSGSLNKIVEVTSPARFKTSYGSVELKGVSNVRRITGGSSSLKSGLKITDVKTGKSSFVDVSDDIKNVVSSNQFVKGKFAGGRFVEGSSVGSDVFKGVPKIEGRASFGSFVSKKGEGVTLVRGDVLSFKPRVTSKISFTESVRDLSGTSRVVNLGGSSSVSSGVKSTNVLVSKVVPSLTSKVGVPVVSVPKFDFKPASFESSESVGVVKEKPSSKFSGIISDTVPSSLVNRKSKSFVGVVSKTSSVPASDVGQDVGSGSVFVPTAPPRIVTRPEIKSVSDTTTNTVTAPVVDITTDVVTDVVSSPSSIVSSSVGGFFSGGKGVSKFSTPITPFSPFNFDVKFRGGKQKKKKYEFDFFTPTRFTGSLTSSFLGLKGKASKIGTLSGLGIRRLGGLK